MTNDNSEKPAPGVEALESKPADAISGFAEALAKKSSPDEDVEAYMKEYLLPVLTPALEQLLQVAASKGELHLDKSGKAPGSAESGSRPEKKVAEAQSTEQAPEEKRKLKKKSKTKTIDAEKEAAAEKPSDEGTNTLEAGESTETEPLPEKFNPLLWLSERFREQAKGRQYKELFEQRMEERRRKRAEEAAAKAAEEEAARLAAEEEAVAAAAAAEAEAAGDGEAPQAEGADASAAPDQAQSGAPGE